ncbi:MAG: MBL fold metallo-hydrolase [Bacteroidetes bacterium]|nr:MAG: MBL fold metallo-hydrolase [Bacteroidota bacterium]
MSLNYHFLSTGYCTAHEAITERGGRWRSIRFHAICVLIQHPTAGYVLFDTGYSPRFHTTTRRWPARLYALATPVTTRPEWAVAEQIRQLGVDPAGVQHILLSHLHADHVAGLSDFPQAQVWCSRVGYDYFRPLRGLSAVRRGFLPGLLPPDLESRLHFFEELPVVERADALGACYDWQGDGSLQLVPLPGHCRGQYGLLLSEAGQPRHLLAADAFWREANLHEGRLPNPVIQVFIDSWSELVATIDRLRAFKKAYPQVPISACHSPATLARVPNADLF